MGISATLNEGASAGRLPDGTEHAVWLAFARNTDAEAARRRFGERYGVAPRHVVVSRGNLLVGPIGPSLVPPVATEGGGAG